MARRRRSRGPRWSGPTGSWRRSRFTSDAQLHRLAGVARGVRGDRRHHVDPLLLGELGQLHGVRAGLARERELALRAELLAALVGALADRELHARGLRERERELLALELELEHGRREV